MLLPEQLKRDGELLSADKRQPRWLFIQLARFGDLMQTVPLIAGAALLDDAPAIDLLVCEDLVPIARCIEGVSTVYSIEQGAWLKTLRDADRSIIDFIKGVKEQIYPLTTCEFDRVVNLTHTRVSAYLTTLLNSRKSVGVLGRRDKIDVVGKWEAYFHKIVSNRSRNKFNLVDIHLGLAEIPCPRKNGYLTHQETTTPVIGEFKDYLQKNSDPVVMLQLGANSTLRRWSPERFARAVLNIYKKLEARFVLVGSSAEADLAEKFLKSVGGALPGDRLLNLTGKTTLTELVEIMQSTDLLLSGDTGTLHLAAASGVPTVSVFLAMARPEDTAPYGRGHIVFKPIRNCYPCAERSVCENAECHNDISPDYVARAVSQILKGQPVDPGSNSTCNAYVTDFAEGHQILKKTGLSAQANTGKNRAFHYKNGNVLTSIGVSGARHNSVFYEGVK